MTKPVSHAAAGDRSGIFAGIGAYLIWGMLPLYFAPLEGVSTLEIVAHRVVWSVVFLMGVLAVKRGLPDLWMTLRRPHLILPLTASAVLIAGNWLLYIWAVSNHHVLASSLGYFLNPLLNVVLGFVFLKERLRPLQWVAVAIAGVGVAILAAGALSTAWISLALALTFGLYGLVRKTVATGPLVGLAAETSVLLPLALVGIGWWALHGTLAFGQPTMHLSARGAEAMLMAAGVVTAVPLLLFAFAARRMTLATLGLLQYISPTLQMLLGIFVFGEHLTTAHKLAFPLIWAALALYSWSAFRGARAAKALG